MGIESGTSASILRERQLKFELVHLDARQRKKEKGKGKLRR
jgi:hypothetical protein